MSVDLSDKSILPTYQEIASGGATRWLLLKYLTREKLFLSTSGVGSIEELKSLVIRDEIQFGLYRVDLGSQHPARFALLSYLPVGTSGVLRARALVHARSVASLFHKAYVSMMTFSEVSQITEASILKQLEYEPCPPDNLGAVERPPHGRERSNSHSTLTERQLPSLPAPPTPSRPDARDNVTIPSKLYPQAQQSPNPGRRTVSDVYPQSLASAPLEGHQGAVFPIPSKDLSRKVSLPTQTIHRRGPSLEHDPEYRLRMQLELQKSRQRAEREIEEAEAEANSIPKIVKKREVYDLAEEERRRAAEKERQEWMAVRLMREEARKRQEEEEERIRKEKRVEDHNRRLEASRLAQEERSKLQQDTEHSEQQEKEKSRMRRAASRANLAKIRKQHALSLDSVKEGFIYTQPSDSVIWRRRYFVLSRESMSFFRDNKKEKLLESLPLFGRGLMVKEWDQGIEELRDIPHSFGFVFEDGGESWNFYTESEEEKGVILSLVSDFGSLKL